MKKLISICLFLSLMVSCGKVESPEEFFDITGNKGEVGRSGDDGIKGEDGEFNGQVAHVEVCPDGGAYNETLVFIDGKYLAFFDASDRRLVLLKENVNYMTTDGRYLVFKIVNGNIVCR